MSVRRKIARKSLVQTASNICSADRTESILCLSWRREGRDDASRTQEESDNSASTFSRQMLRRKRAPLIKQFPSLRIAKAWEDFNSRATYSFIAAFIEQINSLKSHNSKRKWIKRKREVKKSSNTCFVRIHKLTARICGARSCVLWLHAIDFERTVALKSRAKHFDNLCAFICLRSAIRCISAIYYLKKMVFF